MSLLNEALRKNNSPARSGSPFKVPDTKNFNPKKPLYIVTVIIIAAAIVFWSLSIRRSSVPKVPAAVSNSPEQKNLIVTNNSPLTGAAAVNEIKLRRQTKREAATSSENKTAPFPVKSAFEHIASRGSDDQTSQETGAVANGNNIKAATASGSSAKTSQASAKPLSAKVEPNIAEGRSSLSQNAEQEDKVDVVDGFYQKALQFHRDGRMEEAINMYREVLKFSPDNARASYNLSSAYIEASKYYEAYAILNNLLASNPGSPEIKLNLAIAEIGLARPAEAIELLNSVSTEDKKLRFIKFLHLGVATSHSGNLEDALAFYKKAEEIDAGYPELLYNIALTNDKLGNYNDAAAYYKKFLATGSSSHDETEPIKARISTLQKYSSGN